MINSKLANQLSSEEKLFKMLESIDWKLWEMYNILKAQTEGAKVSTKAVSAVKKTKTSAKTDN